MVAEIRYTFTDEDGDSAETAVFLPDAQTLVTYTEWAIAHVPTLEDMTNGLISNNARLSLPVDISALTGNIATDDSDVERMYQFALAAANGEPHKINVPGVDTPTIIAGSDEIDPADLVIAPIIAALEDGIAVTGGTVVPCDIGESDLVTTLYVRKHIKNSGSKV